MQTYLQSVRKGQADNKNAYKVHKLDGLYVVKKSNRHIEFFRKKEKAEVVALFLNIVSLYQLDPYLMSGLSEYLNKCEKNSSFNFSKNDIALLQKLLGGLK